MHVPRDPGPESAGTLDHAVEVRDLEPEERAVAERRVRGRERTVVILDVDAVESQTISPSLTICSYASPPCALRAPTSST